MTTLLVIAGAIIFKIAYDKYGDWQWRRGMARRDAEAAELRKLGEGRE